jgi:hypothetical protein
MPPKHELHKISLVVILFLIHAYFWKMVIFEMTKPLISLMKLVNLDTTRAQGKENEVLYNGIVH